MKKLLKLTADSYYSVEANMDYMSASQFKAFMKCEAAALAEARGEYKRPSTTAMLVGSFVDAHFEGTKGLFISEHPEIVKRDGTLKQEFQDAYKIIKRIEEDRLFSLLMSGRKQVIKTGKIAGVPFKIKIDSLLGKRECKRILKEFPETEPVLALGAGLINDLKIMRDTKPLWDSEDEMYKPFAEYWGYDIQGAIYQAIDGRGLPFTLSVATKEETPDLEAYVVPGAELSARLEEVKQWAPKFQRIKLGLEAPHACGKCPYCRAHKRLTRFVDYTAE